MNSLITIRDLTKLTLYEGQEIYTTDDIAKVVTAVRKQDSIYLSNVGKLIKTATIKTVEIATPVEKFVYFDLQNLPAQIGNLLKDKIQQSKDAGTADKITPETLQQWIEAIRNHIEYYQEAKRDTSPEAQEARKKAIEETRKRLAQKLSMQKWTSTPQ